MAIKVETVEAYNRESFLSVVSTVYDGNRPPDFSKDLPDCDHYLASDYHGKQTVPAGIYRRLPFNTFVGSQSHPTSGIALVGVIPEYRSSGVGKKLLEHAVRTAFQEEKSFLALYPFSERFYRQFGFAASRPLAKIQCLLELVPKPAAELSPRRIDHKNLLEIEECYRQFAKRRSGYCDRTPFLWNRKLLANPNYLIYGFGDPLEAYIFVDLKPSFHEPQEIHEFVWLSRRGYESALKFLPSVAINKSEIRWLEPEESPFLRHYVLDSNRTITYSRGGHNPNLMIRIASVPKFFERLSVPNGKGAVEFAMNDPIAPENNGPWIFNWANFKGVLKRTPQAQISLEPGVLAQLGIGAIHPRRWLLDNYPAIGDDVATSLEMLFPTRDVGCFDFY